MTQRVHREKRRWKEKSGRTDREGKIERENGRSDGGWQRKTMTPSSLCLILQFAFFNRRPLARKNRRLLVRAAAGGEGTRRRRPISLLDSLAASFNFAKLCEWGCGIWKLGARSMRLKSEREM